MKKAEIGTILRERIKECGYTQEDFAEKAGIAHSTLKKYLKETTSYSYKLLMKFAELLNCSYDYLLGYSESAVREHHEIKEQIRLSDEAIRRLVEYSAHYDTNGDAKRYIKVVDMIIQQKGLVTCMADYFLSSSYYVQDMSDSVVDMITQRNPNIPDIVKEDIYALNIEETRLIYLISLLKDTKHLVSDEFLKELKEMDMLNKIQNGFQLVNK